MSVTLKLNANKALIRNAVTGALCSTCCIGDYWLIEGVKVPSRYPFSTGDQAIGGFFYEIYRNGNNGTIYYMAIKKTAPGHNLVWAYGGFENVGGDYGVWTNHNPDENGAPASVEWRKAGT